MFPSVVKSNGAAETFQMYELVARFATESQHRSSTDFRNIEHASTTSCSLPFERCMRSTCENSVCHLKFSTSPIVKTELFGPISPDGGGKSKSFAEP